MSIIGGGEEQLNKLNSSSDTDEDDIESDHLESEQENEGDNYTNQHCERIR